VFDIKVKICGLRDAASLEMALDAGADYVGLVFFPPSPRHLSLAAGRSLAEQVSGRAQKVALLVDPSDSQIEDVMAAVDPQLVQLHGSESPARVAALKQRWGLPIIKAIKVASRADVTAADAFGGSADMILFDAKPPKGADRPGGHGTTFDWAILAGFGPRFGRSAWMLSGGLHPGNVGEAIRATGAAAVDVSSGVETAPGIKDGTLVRAFIAAARAA